MEHKIIGVALTVALYLTMLLTGAFLVRRVIDPFFSVNSNSKIRLLLLLWVAIFVPLTAIQYYLDNFMSDGRTNLLHLLRSDLPLYFMFASAWFSSYWLKRCRSQSHKA